MRLPHSRHRPLTEPQNPEITKKRLADRVSSGDGFGARTRRGANFTRWLFMTANVLLACAATLMGAELRDAKWLSAYLTQPVGQTERGKAYLAEIERAPLEKTIDREWLEHG